MRTHILTILALLWLSGCLPAIAPFPEYAQGWVGASIDRLIEASKRPQSYASRSNSRKWFYTLENGNQVYVSPEREGCIVHWEFNRERIIVGYKTEGNQCH